MLMRLRQHTHKKKNQSEKRREEKERIMKLANVYGRRHARTCECYCGVSKLVMSNIVI